MMNIINEEEIDPMEGIEEVTAPNGYVLNHNAFEVLVDSNTAYQMDQTSGDAIIEVTMENQPVKGKLTIKKSGEVLASFDKDFGYEMSSLADAEFAVYAAEDIYTPDWQRDENGNRIVIHAKDSRQRVQLSRQVPAVRPLYSGW